MMKFVSRIVALSMPLMVLSWGIALAEDDKPKLGWSLEAEFAVVSTAGNSESSTLGLGTTIRRNWERSSLKFDLGGIRTESSLKTRTAMGTVDAFTVSENKVTETTAEAYYGRGVYNYKVTKRFTTFGGVDWLRNEFQGIRSRVLLAAGAGNIWADNDRWRFQTDYGVTYTFEDEVVENPFFESNFPGLRFTYDLWYQVTETTEFKSELLVDWNLDNTDDVRLVFKNGLPVKISGQLLLKPQLDILWRNAPALVEVPIVDGSGATTGEAVFVPLEKTDMILTIALVVKL